MSPHSQQPCAGESLESEYAGMPDMASLVRAFVGDLPRRIAVLNAALQARDLVAVSRWAHQMKGAAGGYGFPPITDAAARLERLSQEGSEWACIEAEAQQIAALCARARAR